MQLLLLYGLVNGHQTSRTGFILIRFGFSFWSVIVFGNMSINERGILECKEPLLYRLICMTDNLK